MTNREWLFSLSDRELAEYIVDSEEFKTIKNCFIDSVVGITKWLSEEKGSMDYLFKVTPMEALKECKELPSVYCHIDKSCENCTYVKERKKELQIRLSAFPDRMTMEKLFPKDQVETIKYVWDAVEETMKRARSIE